MEKLEMTRTQAVQIIIDAIKAGQDKVRSSLSNECIEGVTNGDEECSALYEFQIDQNIPFEQINGILANCNTIEEFAAQIAESDIPLYHLYDERIDQYALTELCKKSRTVKLFEYLHDDVNGGVVDIFAHVYGDHYQESDIPESHRVGLERALGDSRFMLKFIQGQTEGLEPLTIESKEDWNEFYNDNLQLAITLLENLECIQNKTNRTGSIADRNCADGRGV